MDFIYVHIDRAIPRANMLIFFQIVCQWIVDVNYEESEEVNC